MVMKRTKNFMLLNDLENKFDTKIITFSKNTKIKNHKKSNYCRKYVVSKYQFENEQIKIFKYEK